MTSAAKSREELQAELEAAVSEAFDRYGVLALWSYRRPADVDADTGRWIAHNLRLEAPARARPLVLRLEELSDALDAFAASNSRDHLQPT